MPFGGLLCTCIRFETSDSRIIPFMLEPLTYLTCFPCGRVHLGRPLLKSNPESSPVGIISRRDRFLPLLLVGWRRASCSAQQAACARILNQPSTSSGFSNTRRGESARNLWPTAADVAAPPGGHHPVVVLVSLGLTRRIPIYRGRGAVGAMLMAGVVQ